MCGRVLEYLVCHAPVTEMTDRAGDRVKKYADLVLKGVRLE